MATSIPTVRPPRTESLMVLSGAGQIPASLEEALAHRDRARHVSVATATKQLLKLPRVRILELGAAPPPWIGELKHLRSLTCRGPFKRLPPVLATLPHLRYLHLDGTGLERLDGIEQLPALETVTVSNTPVGNDAAALAALAKRIGARVTDVIAGLDFVRKAAPAPRDRKALAKQLRADALDDRSDLRKVDLTGETFEDLFVSHDLRGANLANTTWRRCDFDFALLTGADLAGATFDDCYFVAYPLHGNLRRIKGAGATFVGCGGTLELAGADLRQARLLDLAPDTELELDKVRGAGLRLEATFASEREHVVSAVGADLRGAQIRFDVSASRRGAIASKPGAKLAWKKSHLEGAKLDDTTQLEYAAPQPAVAPAAPSAAAAAPSLATIHADDALQVLAVDVADAASWKGGTGKPGVGVVAAFADADWSHVWAVEHGVALVDCTMKIGDPKKRDQALATRVAGWPVVTKPKSLGRVTVHSGVLALIVPARDGTFSAPERARAARGEVVIDQGLDRVLVPLPPGVYDVEHHPFRPVRGQGAYQDEAGTYRACIRITYRDRLPKQYRST